jgi:enoyl reductase-like protein
MLKTKIYSKGKQILTVEDLINAPSTLFLKDKRCKSVEFCIDNPVNSVLSIFEKDKIKEFIEAGLENYDIWERVEEDREIVFSDKVDNMLDDMLSSFALEYADNEYHEAELMEKFLHELKEKFRIEVREDE